MHNPFVDQGVVNYGRIFSCCSMLLSLGSTIGWGLQGDVRKSLYWAAATVINATFVF